MKFWSSSRTGLQTNAVKLVHMRNSDRWSASSACVSRRSLHSKCRRLMALGCNSVQRRRTLRLFLSSSLGMQSWKLSATAPCVALPPASMQSQLPDSPSWSFANWVTKLELGNQHTPVLAVARTGLFRLHGLA